MTARTEGLDELLTDFGKAQAEAIPKIQPILTKAGVQIKKQLRSDLNSSASFRPAARSITFDTKVLGFAGDAVIRLEVGPDSHAADTAALAGLAYFGGSRGGGGTVPDPVVALRREAETVIGFIDMAIEGLL